METVGDCYVAVAGLPDPRKDHAVAMAKFAFDCLKKVTEVTKKLEVALGPDTADLTVRVGLHVSIDSICSTHAVLCLISNFQSGPVTAGVLRVSMHMSMKLRKFAELTFSSNKTG